MTHHVTTAATAAELTGIGRLLLNGQVVAERVQYHVSLSRTLHGAAEGDIAGAGHIGGRLLSSFRLWLIGESIELEMQDGRRWACSIQSSHGSLQNEGGIHSLQPLASTDR